jgi:hypothetical protein
MARGRTLASVVIALAALATPADADEIPLATADVNDADVAAALRSRFGQRIDFGKVTSLAGDVTCDGAGDVVVTYWNPDRPEEPALHVMIVTYAVPDASGIGAAAIVVDLPFSNDMQFALCGRPQATPVALEEWTAADIAETFALPVCRTAIRVEDPECDRPRLFWITGKSEDGRIAFYRN